MSTAKDIAVVVFSTAPSVEVAEHLAHALVEERLAACVTRIPGAQSTYRGEDRIEDTSEVLLLIKTHSGRAAELSRRLADLHPYEVPEILALPVGAGSPSYLAWIRESTNPEEPA